MADENKTIVVETTGDFMAQDPTNGQVIEAYGATEVEETAFIKTQIEAGRLKESKVKKAKEASKPASPVETLNENPSLTEQTEAALDDSKSDGSKKKKS